jgi:hypothetical protein
MATPDRGRPVRHLQALYTVVVGLALTVAITNLVDQEASIPVRFSVLPYFLAYLFTLVPIYHGALRHLDVTYLESLASEIRAGALMADWSLLFLESCILLAMAALLQRPETFSYVLTGLLAFDMLWGFGAHLAFSPRAADLRAELKWARINFFTVLILIGIIVFLDSLEGTEKPVATYRWMLILTIAIARTVFDYWWCWNYYYPGHESSA